MASPNIWTSALGSAGPAFAIAPGQYLSGTIYWVDYNAGNDANAGTTPWLPKKTWANAVATAANNDTIVLAPSHAEPVGSISTVTNSVTTIGLGSGAATPSLTLSAGATLAFTATLTRFHNVAFPAATSAIAGPKISVTTGSSLWDSCTFTAGQNENGCLSVSGGRMAVSNCTFTLASFNGTNPTYGITVAGAGADHSLVDTTFDGGAYGWLGAYFSTATTRLDVRNVTLLNKSKFQILTTGSTYNLFGLRAGDTSPCPIQIAA